MTAPSLVDPEKQGEELGIGTGWGIAFSSQTSIANGCLGSQAHKLCGLFQCSCGGLWLEP